MIYDATVDGKVVNKKIIAEKVLGISKSNFANKLKRDSISNKDLVKIADYLGLKVTIEGNGHSYGLKKEE